MLYSMTGFGSAEKEVNNYHLKAEIKTLNSKFLDIGVRLSPEVVDKEPEIKNLLSQHLKRGKVNLIVECHSKEFTEPIVHINEPLFRSYFQRYKKMAVEVEADEKDLFRLALYSPDVMASDEMIEIFKWEEIEDIFIQAINKCNDYRKQEGKILQEKLTSYIEEIRAGLKEVEIQDPNRIKLIKDRLESSIDEIRQKVQVDQNRFEQELIYYIEKLDITEEKVRLARHLDYFLEVMETSDSQGKKLGFISQEIGREINTIGAKANDAIIQRAVVRMKDELEKIKEQSMNIL